jgi:hypothetical protein
VDNAERNKDIQAILVEGMELNVWMVSGVALKDKEFLEKYGAYGAAFYYEGEAPQTTEDAEYSNSPLGAIDKAIKRWR